MHDGRMVVLLDKLEKIRKELQSDKVFDCIGRIFDGVSIKRYMELAVTGDAATKPYLFHMARLSVVRRADPELPDLAKEEVLDCRLVGIRQEEGAEISICPVEHLLLLKGGQGIPAPAQRLAVVASGQRDLARAYLAERISRGMALDRKKSLVESVPERERFVLRGFDCQETELATARAKHSDNARKGKRKAMEALEEVKRQQRELAARRQNALTVLRREPDLIAPGEVTFLAHPAPGPRAGSLREPARQGQGERAGQPRAGRGSGGDDMSASPSIAPRQVVAPLKARKHLRMQGWDFTSPGWYFLTMCTKNMKPVFGTVVNDRMALNDPGRIADQCWREIQAHFPRAVVHEHVVMPNHVHGLLHLTPDGWAINGITARREAFGKPVAGSVPTIVRSYKAAVSKALGESIWQSRFYEVRARDDAARANIRRYIRHNPENYAAVMQGAQPQFMGNKDLLDWPKVGFLASRGEPGLHGRLPIQPGEVLMSGFLSPMERAVFRAGLARKQPMIWVLPAGLDAIQGNTACRVAMEEGRLLVVSPFDEALDAPNARRAAWCNHYVVTHCGRLVVGHLKPDGMLACILAEADPEKEVIRL